MEKRVGLYNAQAKAEPVVGAPKRPSAAHSLNSSAPTTAPTRRNSARSTGSTRARIAPPGHQSFARFTRSPAPMRALA